VSSQLICFKTLSEFGSGWVTLLKWSGMENCCIRVYWSREDLDKQSAYNKWLVKNFRFELIQYLAISGESLHFLSFALRVANTDVVQRSRKKPRQTNDSLRPRFLWFLISYPVPYPPQLRHHVVNKPIVGRSRVDNAWLNCWSMPRNYSELF